MEQSKQRWAAFMVLFYLVTTIFRRYVAVKVGSYRNMSMGIILLSTVIGCAIGAGLLMLALGRRQITILLYVIGLIQLVAFIRAYSSLGVDSPGNFPVIYMRLFKTYPLVAISDILTLVYTILLLVTAVRMTMLERKTE